MLTVLLVIASLVVIVVSLRALYVIEKTKLEHARGMEQIKCTGLSTDSKNISGHHFSFQFFKERYPDFVLDENKKHLYPRSYALISTDENNLGRIGSFLLKFIHDGYGSDLKHLTAEDILPSKVNRECQKLWNAVVIYARDETNIDLPWRVEPIYYERFVVVAAGNKEILIDGDRIEETAPYSLYNTEDRRKWSLELQGLFALSSLLNRY